MPRFKVRVARMEEIDFELEADDEMDAMERYLSDGEETNSRTLDTNILYVDEIGDEA